MGTESEASNPYDSDHFARIRERVLAEINRAHTAAFDEYYERTGEMPTSSAQLWDRDRRGELAAPVFDMIAATAPAPTDGMWDLYAARDAATRALARATGPYPTEQLYDLTAPEMSTVGLPVIGPGEWTVPGPDDFAAVYAAVDPGNDDTGDWENPKPCYAVGGGIDPAFARAVVEEAMALIGMSPHRATEEGRRRWLSTGWVQVVPGRP